MQYIVYIISILAIVNAIALIITNRILTETNDDLEKVINRNILLLRELANKQEEIEELKEQIKKASTKKKKEAKNE